MLPVLYDSSLAGIHIRLATYPAMLALGAVAGLALALAVAAMRGVRPLEAASVLVPALVAIPVGARLLHVLVAPDYYAARPGAAFALDTTGFVLYGGLGAAVVVGAVAARIADVDLWTLADATVPGIALGIALARLGCFGGGCCFGVEAQGPAGVTFPIGSQAHAAQLLAGSAGLLGPVAPVVPTQLLEAAAAVLSAAAVLAVAKRLAPGVGFLLFAAAFGIARVVIGFWLWPDPTAAVSAWFFPATYSALAAICLALAWARSRPVAAAAATGLPASAAAGARGPAR